MRTGILDPALARRFGCGGYVGRASGRGFDARRTLAYPPYDSLRFDVPVLRDGDVNARVWIRIREVEQSLGLVDQILERLPPGDAVRASVAATGTEVEGMAVVEGFRGDVLAWLRLDAEGTRGALSPARPLLVPVAGAGGRDRGQHRRRLPALQQILQLLLFGARSLEATLMRKLLLESLLKVPVTEPAPDSDAAASPNSPARSTARRAPRWAAASRSARSMPAPAMPANWRSTRWATPSTISNGSACDSSLRRAMPTCCW